MAKFDESRIITDETGYNYVRVTPEEVRAWGGYNICNGCNGEFLDEDMNLFWAGTDTYCDKCFNEMKKRWKHYSKEDLDYDISKQNEMALDWYKYHLDSDFRDEIIRQNSTQPMISPFDLITDDEFMKILEELGGSDES